MGNHELIQKELHDKQEKLVNRKCSVTTRKIQIHCDFFAKEHMNQESRK